MVHSYHQPSSWVEKIANIDLFRLVHGLVKGSIPNSNIDGLKALMFLSNRMLMV